MNLAADRLQEILCKREQRYVGSQLTFSFERRRIMLEESEVTRGLVGRYVETYAFADGRLDVRWKGHSLPYSTFDKDQQVTHTTITENKRLSDVLAYIKERQEQVGAGGEEQQRKEQLRATRSRAGTADGFRERSRGDRASQSGPGKARRCGIRRRFHRLKAQAEWVHFTAPIFPCNPD